MPRSSLVEWTEGRRCLGLELRTRARAAITTVETHEEASTDTIAALSV
ncbi:hypothetical protein [Pseudonocardia sediminis]|nr:hypothetical protein [Pseudonocardia sediminis]